MIDFSKIFPNIATDLGLGAAAGSIAGGITSAIGAEDAAAATARADILNADIQGNTAARARTAASQNQVRLGYQAAALAGRQGADYGAANIGGASGSPTDVTGDTERQISQEALNIVYGGQMQAENAGQQARLYGMQAKAARQAGDTAAVSDILGGIGGATKMAASLYGGI